MNSHWICDDDLYQDIDAISDMYNPQTDDTEIQLTVAPDGEDAVFEPTEDKPSDFLPTERPKPLSLEDQDSLMDAISKDIRRMNRNCVSEEEGLLKLRSEPLAVRPQNPPQPLALQKVQASPEKQLEGVNGKQDRGSSSRCKNVAMANINKLISKETSKRWVPMTYEPFKIKTEEFPPLS